MLEAGFWRGRRVLLTGHTGFKGAWLSLWLNHLGAKVAAMALAPERDRDLYNIVRPELTGEVIGDVCDAALVNRTLTSHKPEIVLHLAAQSLVRRSYKSPSDTFATNVMGTAHVLDAVRQSPSVKAVLVITTDKVYENLETGRAFVESDPLGGHDPYSASKACADILTASFSKSFFQAPDGPIVATARAGNVIGGGDWSEDRIVPDIVRAMEAGSPVRLRYPSAVRPWQHVLEPLAGYLQMAEAMYSSGNRRIDTLNFAPDLDNEKTVATLVEAFTAAFGGRPGWVQEPVAQPCEAQLLTLSAAKAKTVLGWRPLLGFDETIRWTADWYQAFVDNKDMRDVTLAQIAEYERRLGQASISHPSKGRTQSQ
jgi:CDP-glucose 4,6-dehydratase